MIKAVIFDMDGVLIDTVATGLRVRKRLLKQYGVDLDAVPDPQGENHRAASLKTLLASVKDHHGIHIDQDEFAKQSIEHMYEELRGQGASADPALIRFLEELKTHHISCAIASSSLRKSVDTKLKILAVKDYFSVIVTGDDITEHKPKPDTYVFAMKELGLPPEECVIFEDSLTGVRAGQAAGCRVIGFAQYNPPKEPLPGVIATVRKWDEITYDKLRHILASAS